MKSRNMRLALGLATSVVALGAMTGSAFAAAPTAVTATVAPTITGASGNALDGAGNLVVYSTLSVSSYTGRTCTPGASSICKFTRYRITWFRSTSSNPGNTSADWTAIAIANAPVGQPPNCNSTLTCATYKVGRQDIGRKIRVRVQVCYNDGSSGSGTTWTNELCSSSSTTPNTNWSAATSMLATHKFTTQPALSNTSPPFYTRTLWAGEGVIDGNPATLANRTIAYQWETCTNAVTDGAGTPTSVSGCSNVDAQTGTTTLKPANCQPVRPAACVQNQGANFKAFTLPKGKYIGTYMRCKITITIAGIAVTAYTNASKAVYDPGFA